MEKQIIKFKKPFRILWGRNGMAINVKAVYVYSDGTIGNFIDTDGNEYKRKVNYELLPIHKEEMERVYWAVISALIEEKR